MRSPAARFGTLLTLATLLLPSASALAASSLVISQIYGGGGSPGASYTNDFIEIFNRSGSTVSLTGWTIQYANTAASAWTSTTLSGSLAAGHYLLVQGASSGANGAALPTPDVTGTINVASNGGKVALCNSMAVLSGTCPVSAAIVDLVGYGGANCFEGSQALGTSGVVNAVFRQSGGCLDTDNNLNDFFVAPASPRSSATPASLCSGLAGGGNASPNFVNAGGTTLLTVTVTPGQSPTSTGIVVTGDLAAIGGAATQSFYDDGTHGDVSGGDLTYSYQATVGANVATGLKTLPISIGDAEARTGTATISVTTTLPAGALVISQVYAGGGLTGAAYQNSFIELLNRTNATLDLSGLSVQWASGNSGSGWQSTNLTGTVAAGRYVLIQEAGGANGSPLPTPDIVGSIAMSASSGKVALMGVTQASAAACPTAVMLDLIGYGGNGNVNCYEGTPVDALSSATAALRNDGGCRETNDNSADFTIAAPQPRNSQSAARSCTPSSPGGTGAATPNSLAPGASVTLTVKVSPGTNPVSTGIAVAADLSGIGGAAAQTFFDDGTHGDATGGDGTFTFQTSVAVSTPAGPKSLPVAVTDAQLRTGSTSIDLTVTEVTGVPVATSSFALVSVGLNPGAAPRRVTFSLPSSLPARLELIDVTGRVVDALEVGSLGGGLHQVAIGADAAAGIYFVRLRQGQRMIARSVAIVR